MSELTMLDIAARSGSDKQVGLIEEVLTFAPEFRTIPVRVVPGTSYRTTVRTARPKGAFRHAGEGVTPSASTYIQKLVECYFFDCQMQLDEAKRNADAGSLEDLLSDEASGAVEENFISIGQQIYGGTTADAKGFSGFNANVDSTMVVDAAGTGSDTETAWAVWENVKGVHIPVGNGGNFSMPEWTKQRITDPNDATKAYMAYVTNLSGWIGLAFGSKYSIGCVKNITTSKPLTDQLGAALAKKFKISQRPTRWFMSPNTKFLLQASRSATLGQKDSGRGDAFAASPTSLADIPIQETDCIATRAAW